MEKRRILITRLVGAIAALAVIATIIFGVSALSHVSSPQSRDVPFTRYSDRYNTNTLNINSSAGAFRERDYTPAASSATAMPENGRLLINPMQSNVGESGTPTLTRANYTIESATNASIYARLTNSKRTEERTTAAPDAAILSLSFENTLPDSSWQQLVIYNNANREELVDSALLFAPETVERSYSWQGGVSLYLLDGELTQHAAAILPGVNIINTNDEEGRASGVLYTNRPLAIGSLPRMVQDEPALRSLEAEASTWQLEGIDTLRMDTSQHIIGTDLIFAAPQGKRIVSTMQAPVSRSGRSNGLTVEGGVIAVNEGVTLEVGSGEIGTANPLTSSADNADAQEGDASTGSTNAVDTQDAAPSTTKPTEGAVMLSPRAIIVDGGTLVLCDSPENKLIVNADIQVRNGG